MELAQQTTSLVLSLRKKERIIVRQPLQRIAIPVTDPLVRTRLEAVQQLVLDEVNVKTIDFVEGQMLEKKVKCNFRVMGKKFGKLMKAVNEVVTAISQDQIAELEKNGTLTVVVEGESCLIERNDVEIISEDMPGWSVANEGALTVALDITITDELRNEVVLKSPTAFALLWSNFLLQRRLLPTSANLLLDKCWQKASHSLLMWKAKLSLIWTEQM